MIDPHDVVEAAHVTDSCDPPAVSVLLHLIPVKERIAPELPVRREIIRRAPGDLNRCQVLIELELIRVGPDIDAVSRYIDRNIADNLDSILVGVGLELRPLSDEEELHCLPEINIIFIFCPQLRKHLRLPEADIIIPLGPRAPFICVLERHEQRVIVEPERVPAELVVIGRRIFKEPFACNPENRISHLVHQTVIYVLLAVSPVLLFVFLRLKQSVLRQHVKIDHVRISRECGKALIRTVAVARRTHRQDLPVALPALLQKIYELICLTPHRSDSIWGWKTCDVHQYAICSHFILSPDYKLLIRGP